MSSGARVVVVGSVNLDVVLRVPRIPPPGATVRAEALEHHPGGKGANQAVAAARAGAPVTLVGAVGDDEAGRDLLGWLDGNGVDTGAVAVVGAPTGRAHVMVDPTGENAIVVAAGANDHVSSGIVHRLLRPGDVLVCQLEIPPAAVVEALSAARRAGAVAVLNAAPEHRCPPEALAAADVLVVNGTEAVGLGAGPTPDEARRLLTRPDGVVIVTLGGAGAVVVTGEDAVTVPGRTVPVVDTTGAGDCFVGYLAAGLAEGDLAPDAAARANVAASLAVGVAGAGPSMPLRDAVEQVISGEA